MGPCLFDTVRVTEIPYSHGQGSPSLIHLSWQAYQTEGMAGSEIQFRAHETAHQWWGHVVDNESYRDTWITEGIADYFGLLFYELVAKDPEKSNKVLDNWKENIFSGSGAMSWGSKAGPPVMGYRLVSSASDDYQSVVYDKSAYIFHMIRYLLHDYSTSSDDAFITLMRNLSIKYRNRPISTERLKKALEEQIGDSLDWFFDQ